MVNYQEILEMLVKNPTKGLEQLYVSYGSKFYSYAVRRWNLNEDEAWDVVYKTLETLVLKLSNYQFTSATHFDNFLYKVLLNFIRQYFRSNRSKQAHLVQYVDVSEEDIAIGWSQKIDGSAFTEYFSSETAESPSLKTLNELLDHLDPVDKDLLLLRAQNYSYEEIATLLGLENQQLKVKYFRAKEKLSKLYKQTQNKQS